MWTSNGIEPEVFDYRLRRIVIDERPEKLVIRRVFVGQEQLLVVVGRRNVRPDVAA